MIKFECPVCGKSYSFPDNRIGSFVGSCGLTFIINEDGVIRFNSSHPEVDNPKEKLVPLFDKDELSKRFLTNDIKDADAVHNAQFAAGDVLGTAAMKLNDIIPDCREKSLVITKLEEALHWANTALIRTL